MPTHSDKPSFGLGSSVTYAGTHICGRETETPDTDIYELRMLKCLTCGVLFPATKVRIYLGISGAKQDLIKEQTLEQFDREHPGN